jgi:hypothetical protein
MVRILWLLKRKPGISFDQFRSHYETSHAALGQRYFGHLLLGYRRNYDLGVDGTFPGPPSPGYDCITEWTLRDAAALDEIFRLLVDPEIAPVFREDEAKFLDSTQTRLVRCDTRDTGPGDGAETLRLKGAAPSQ